MNMKKYLIIFAMAFMLMAMLLVTGCGSQPSLAQKQVTAKESVGAIPAGDGTGEKQKPTGKMVVENGYEVKVSAAGFEPRELKIKAGDSVIFKATDNVRHWPASAMHPTHSVYPGSHINKCNTAERESIFDACRPLLQGEVFEFRFTEKGSWKYHDHLNPTSTGTVVVE